jgi:hypothetical protein
VTTGRLDSGAFAAGLNVDGINAADGPPDLAMRGDGTALLAWQDFSTSEVRIARRDGNGAFGAVQTVRCPSPRALPVAAGIDAAGVASVLYRRRDSAPAVRPWWLVQDAVAETASPGTCGADTSRKQYPLYDPMMPAPGQEVTIDVEGTRDPDVPETTWRWDMDHDGTFEVDTGTVPLLRHTFDTEGIKPWQLEVASPRTGTAIYDFWIQVMRPSAPPAPFVVPVPSSTPAPGPRGAVAVKRGQKLSTVLEKGLLASVTTRTAGASSVELWIDAKEAKRLKLGKRPRRLARKAVTLRAGAVTPVRLKLSKATAKRLRHARRIVAGIALIQGGTPLASLPVTVKR